MSSDEDRPELDAPPEGRHEAAAFLIVGLLGIALMAVGVGALVLPPGVAFALVRRGLGEGHASWVALGAGVGVLWLVLLAVAARKLLHRGQRAAKPQDVG